MYIQQVLAGSPTIITDNTPNAFTFTSQTNANLSAVTLSNTVTITGINIPTSVSITAGTGDFSINGGAFVTTGTITNGQTLQLRQTASGSVSTVTSMTVLVGTVSSSWSITTVAVAPDPYFANVFSLIPFANSYTDVISGNNPVNGACTISETGASNTSYTAYLNYPARSDSGGWAVATNQDFTVEAFVIFHESPRSYNWGLLSFLGASSSSFSLTASGGPMIWWNGVNYTVSGLKYASIVAGTRYHFAAVRSANRITCYVNGVAGGYITQGAGTPTTNKGRMLTGPLVTIDNFRFTKDVARYTSNFTVPSSPFPTY